MVGELQCNHYCDSRKVWILPARVSITQRERNKFSETWDYKRGSCRCANDKRRVRKNKIFRCPTTYNLKICVRIALETSGILSHLSRARLPFLQQRGRFAIAAWDQWDARWFVGTSASLLPDFLTALWPPFSNLQSPVLKTNLIVLWSFTTLLFIFN